MVTGGGSACAGAWASAAPATAAAAATEQAMGRVLREFMTASSGGVRSVPTLLTTLVSGPGDGNHTRAASGD
ncbi:hypothetical protein GCM10022231_18270 [Gordonia caeni]|uniref:Uncharacterized protein n=1 Tax=Gordonia caeni TaxID=1007097 RepID=A0ABP7P3B9_9ACTN